MNIYLIRHGETSWNAGARWQGRSDMELNETGLAQGAGLTEWFAGKSVGKIYASPLKRAYDTAKYIQRAVGAELVTMDELMEMDAGDFEGADYTKLATDPRFIAWDDDGARCPNGESKQDVYDRVIPAFLSIADNAAKKGGEDFALAAHSIVIRVIVNYVLGLPPSCRRQYMLENGSVTTLLYDIGGKRFTLRRLNEKP